jgi:rubrerythrin
MTTNTGNGQSQQPISNLEYDFITVLHNKAEAVKAYDTYIQDAEQAGSQPCVELFQKLRQSDVEQAQEIRQHLQAVMQHGKM